MANAGDIAREVIAALRRPAAGAGGGGINERVNPFGDLGDFASAAPRAKAEHKDVVEEVAAQYGFPGRQPAKPAAAPAVVSYPPPRRQQRRYSTGRNKQIKINATDETIKCKRLYQLADVAAPGGRRDGATSVIRLVLGASKIGV